MEVNGEESTTVTLSALRLTDFQEAPDKSTNDTDARDDESKSRNVASYSAWGPRPPPGLRGPEAYERMAADKPGEELAHDATIWKLYLQEAEEYDQELVKSRHGSLDMLLLFAGLFSAILTAFLIESKNLLQQDPADASVALLLLAVQAQQRVELGLPSPMHTPLDNLPPFVPPSSARWINGIWFTSLALSLSAALIAMLGKEWLTAYLASRPRPAHSHTLLRQARLEGLERWWALHIIALLPSLLHMSLFLFAIGLVVYLWILDAVVAGIIAGVIIITSLFYIATAILGAVYEHCPFVTQISGYIKRAFNRYLCRHAPGNERPNITTVEDLKALVWLADHARDPAVVDCSFQALAGLQLQVNQALFSRPVDAQVSCSPISPKSSLPMRINPDTTLLSLFDTVVNRFEKVAANQFVSPAASGATLAAYAAAMVRLFQSISPMEERNAAHIEENDNMLNRIARRPHSQPTPTLQTSQTLPSSAQVLDLLETLWNNNGLAFSANSYASFLTAQLELLCLTASIQPRALDTQNRLRVEESASARGRPATMTRDVHVIDIAAANPNSTYYELTHQRACYSRTLCRASYLLWLHSHKRIHIEASGLIGLLDAMSCAAGCEALNPRDSISTHHPQYITSKSSTFQMEISATRADKWIASADNLHIGPLGSLIKIFAMRLEVADDLLSQTRTAAANAFSILAPVLLQQVLQSDRTNLLREFEYHNWSNLPILDMQRIRYVAARQMLLVLRYLGPNIGKSAMHPAFCFSALSLIRDYMAEGGTPYNGAHLALCTHGGDLIPLLEFAGSSSSNLEMLSQPIKFHLVKFAQTLSDRGATICETALSPACFPVLIRMISTANIDVVSMQTMLQSMVSRIRNGPASPQLSNTTHNSIHSSEYLKCFTQTDQGFSALSEAAGDDRCREVIVEAIVELVHLAANCYEILEGARIELKAPAVPAFLNVVSLLANYCSDHAERQEMLLKFSQAVVPLLHVAREDSESSEIIAMHSACDHLYSALEAIGKDEVALEELDMVRDLRSALGIRRPVRSLDGFLDVDSAFDTTGSCSEGYPDREYHFDDASIDGIESDDEADEDNEEDEEDEDEEGDILTSSEASLDSEKESEGGKEPNGGHLDDGDESDEGNDLDDGDDLDGDLDITYITIPMIMRRELCESPISVSTNEEHSVL